MKNLSNIFGIVALWMLATVPFVAGAHTDDLPDVKIEKLDAQNKVCVTLLNVEHGATVRLTDGNGKMLVLEEIEAGEHSFRKVFNLKRLSAGNYFFHITMKNKEVTQPLSIGYDGELTLKPEDRQVYLVPTIQIGEDFVDVNWFNGRQTDMTVGFKRSNGDVVFKEELNDIRKVERRYNLSELARGSYTVIVSTPYKTHYKEVVIK